MHTKRNAVDLIPQRNVKGEMRAIWDSKDKETKKIISIMTQYGFEAGANWSTTPDSPHFQIKDVSATAKSYSSTNTNAYITKMLQRALNEKIGAGLVVDGMWEKATTKAVNKFKAKQGWNENGKVGVDTLKKLIV